ncbi:hypothetical protein VNI00_000037 [Paramarasmius palmivorus]|uniref:Uncharacterized protein n=1 Tax=Paramarasmius palmivorus TaxID=297713 RepID=A0AAW0EFF0_9AGAR
MDEPLPNGWETSIRPPEDDERYIDTFTSVDELNKMLTFNYIYEHEPFDILPGPYSPEPKYDHKPPVFDYAVGMTPPQVEAFVRKHNLISPAPIVDWTVPFNVICRYLNDKYGLTLARGINLGLPVTKQKGLVVYKIATNYGTTIPKEQLGMVMKSIEEDLEIRPMWYFSWHNTLEGDWCILRSKFRRSKRAKRSDSEKPKEETSK